MDEVRRMPELDEPDTKPVEVNFNEIGKYTISYTPQTYTHTTSAEINDYIFSEPEKKKSWIERLLSWLGREN